MINEKSQLIQQYKNQQANFYLYFKKTLNSQDVENIHQLRVSIKKLRAMWILMEAASHKKFLNKDHFALCSKLFDKAGAVREVQVNLGIIEKYNRIYLLPYVEYLRKTKRNAIEKLLREMKVFDLRRFEILDNELLKKIKIISKEIVLKESASYIHKEIIKIGVFVDQLPDDSKLHKIRIHLKLVSVIINIMYELNPATKLDSLQKNIKLLNNQIGQWHDFVALLKSLRYFTEQSLKKKDKLQLKSLICRIELQQETRIKKIHKLLNKNVAQQ